MLKTKISAKTASLAIINNVSPRSQRNHRIIEESSQKLFVGPRLGLNYHHESKGHSEILTQPIIGPSIYTLWKSSVSFWVFVAFDFSKKKPLRFFGSGPILAHFLVFWGNKSSQQRLIEQTFWSQVVLLIVVQMPFKAFWIAQIFIVTVLTQILRFWLNFDSNLPPKDDRNQKYSSGYPNQSKWRPYVLSIFNGIYN